MDARDMYITNIRLRISKDFRLVATLYSKIEKLTAQMSGYMFN